MEITVSNDFSLAQVVAAPLVTKIPLKKPTHDSEGFTASIETQRGHVYRLEWADSAEGSQWQGLRLVAGTGKTLTLRDSFVAGQPRFYRVRRW